MASDNPIGSSTLNEKREIPLFRHISGSRHPSTAILIQVGTTIVDADCYEFLSAHRWYIEQDKQTFYVVRHEKRNVGRRLRLHRVVWGEKVGEIPQGYTIDHRDGNGLNNCLINLRLATEQQQKFNTRPHRGMATGLKGVYKSQSGSGFRSSLLIDGRVLYLGRFRTKEEAATAYNLVVRLTRGEFGVLNDVPPLPEEVMKGIEVRIASLLVGHTPN